MTREQVMALEGEALWEAAWLAVAPHVSNRGGPERAAFAILRAVRGWPIGGPSRFEAILNASVGAVWELEPHHIARAALLAQVKE